MSSSTLEFFSSIENRDAIANAIKKISKIIVEDEFEKSRKDCTLLVLKNMYDTAEEWDKVCTINIEWIGGQFTSSLHKIGLEDKDISTSAQDRLFAYCYRFLFELFLSTKSELSPDYKAVIEFGDKNIDKLSSEAASQIRWVSQQLPIYIFKYLVNSDKLTSVSIFNKHIESIDEKKIQWDKELQEKSAAVDALKSSLEKYKHAFNFVGLYDGFNELSLIKEKEKASLLRWLSVFGVLIVIPSFVQFLWTANHWENILKDNSLALFSFIPTVSLTVILVYFFRIILMNYRSVKLQMLQIDLRKTLCQFIQDYAKFSGDMKDKNPESLSRFEAIIFSSIVSDDDKLPSTYDGLEQVAGLIKSIRG